MFYNSILPYLEKSFLPNLYEHATYYEYILLTSAREIGRQLNSPVDNVASVVGQFADPWTRSDRNKNRSGIIGSGL